MLSNSHTRLRASKRGEEGYVLLTLMLMVALMIIMAGVMLPSITFEIRRDREEEMIHRGVQYSRAIRAYYKKFGRYPVKIEDLESANNLRFLRKRYKDPMNCKNSKCEDFKLLHFGDVKLTFGGSLGGGTIPGANPIGGPAGPGGVGGPGAMGGPGGIGQTSTFGTNVLGGQGVGGLNPPPQAGQNQPDGSNPAATPGTTDSSSSTPTAGQTQGTSGPGGSGPGSSDSSNSGSGQVIGGGPIVGVVSANKTETIREFNHKKKYNEWQFIYDPGTDRGGLLMTPNQPPLLGAGQQPGGTAPGMPGASPIVPQNSQNPQPQNPQNPTNSPVGPGNYYQ